MTSMRNISGVCELALKEFEHQVQLLRRCSQSWDNIHLCARFRREFIDRILAQERAGFES